MFSKYGRDTRNESSLQSMVCYLKYSLKRHMLLLDKVPWLCSSMCHTAFPLCWAQLCATSRKLHLDVCQNAVSAHCAAILVFFMWRSPYPAAPACCCIWTVNLLLLLQRLLSSMSLQARVLLWRQPPQSAPAVVCPGHCVQSPHDFNFGYSTPVLIRCRLDFFGTARNCFLVFLCCKTCQKKYSTTTSLKAAYR